MSNRDRLTLLSRIMLLALLVLTACQPIQSPSASSATAQPVSDQALGAQLDGLLTQLNQEGTFNGAVLIARNGQVVLRKGYGLADREQQIPNTPTTRFRLASLTKQFTALAILMLQEQGKLSVEDGVCQYIQACPASWQTMTIHHLLTHTAGVYDFRDFIYMEQTSPPPSTSAQVIERIKEHPLSFAPGEGFSYTNGGFMVAGYIVEQVSGQSYEQFVQEHIFEPVGMENTGYAHDASSLAIGYRNATTQENPLDGSLPFAAAGLYSTVDDLYLYLQALESGQLISQQSLDAFFGDHMLMGADNGGFSPGYEPPSSYAYGWAVATFHGHRVIGHDGWIEGYGGDVRRYPDDHVTTILLMNLSEPWAALIGDQIAQTIFGTESTAAGPEDDKIANAMSAAPLAIAKDATILDWPTEAGGEMVVLREGANGWTCITDWPASPGNDPSCNDPVWMAWNDAYATGATPQITRLGIGYMLVGGSDPSVDDPFALQPAAGEDWVTTAPHLMLLFPGGFDADHYTADHHSGEPYIMWDGTPYEHLMVPVQGDASQ